ncbi:transglycosylase SLT domain-containing protein [Roseobacter sp. HKCCD9010]|uniref:lytic transglycosylase domain-containing protein n=1 Tax=unclassified Roseobacter TaxID=196798 RepID=UPI00149241BA|nr:MULTISPECIES: lytic transglycosylase domain-containing protein [unclassified Roseobacter]MBF9049146.1 transglycosylase SLT domain-containing protein [Rhodobacterales bacterium HKCCD4356]NNV37570.1 transglycosylase SLT domain-containing protein [Roseobacter sp. HKCCD9054]NNV45780.1 transglycosylase SLT domain-containing protein [Roseobacter sp. HKCCD6265]NNV75712.1 transglycosylase SLT domain-containing protein [Roseobacter sp. HKCCD6135]NNV84401.1 transglycosylase SLT domain-containing prot
MQVTSSFLTIGLSLLAALPIQAQSADPPPFPEFTFRRVAPPAAGHTGPRINIQIEPQVTPVAAPSLTPEPEAPAATGLDWFWSEISPGLAEGAGRFQAALDHLSSAPEAATLGVARLDQLRALSGAHGADILRATVGTPVSPALVLSVMSVESAGASEAISSAGAQGLMQLIPATAERFGVEDAFDVEQNIAGGVAYLAWLIEEFDRDPVLVLAAYNAGEGAVRTAGGVPDYAETRRYVPKVLATWLVARALCLSPPELISDGCVFEAMIDG